MIDFSFQPFRKSSSPSQMQDDIRSTPGLVDHLDRKSPSPADSHFTAWPASMPARREITVTLIGDDEGRIETDAELPDQMGISLA